MALSHVIFASYGNDSLALIQWVRDNRMEREEKYTILYNDTGWAAPWWEDRVVECENWAQQCGFETARTESEGFMDLVRRKKAFPRQGMQFCTEHLKRLPALEWLDENMPKGTTCLVGIRRCESENRKDFPEYMEGSMEHGGRPLWAPLVNHTDEMRDALLERAGFEPLPHRSQECYPCVNANKTDLRGVDEDRIHLIEVFEEEMGVGVRSGNPKYMFRAKKKGGAAGIREVIEWASRDKFLPGHEDMFGGTGVGCDGGFCE